MALTQVSDAGLKTPASDLQDNEKIVLGTGNDLEIYHDGSNSYIKDTGTGNLYIYSENLRIENADGSDSYIEANNGGAAELYWDGSKKLETTSAGIELSGKIVVGSVELSGGGLALSDDDQVVCGSGDDLKIFHDGSDSYINQTGAGNLFIRGNGTNNIHIRAKADEASIRCVPNAQVELYYNDVKKFETGANGVYIQSDSLKYFAGASDELQVFHDGTNSIIKDTRNAGTVKIQADNFSVIDKDASETMLAAAVDGAVELYYDNSKTFETISGGAEVTGQLYVTAEINLINGTTNQSRYIDSGLGDGNSLYLRGCASGDANHETLAQFTRNEACSLRWDNSTKLETASTGVGITGKLFFDGDGGAYIENTAANELTVKTDSTVCTTFAANQRVKMPQVYSTNGSSMNDVQIESDGTLCAGNTSIRASKKNIVSQTDVSWLYDLNPVTFNYRKKLVHPTTGEHTYLEEVESETAYGLIAEEVETVKKDFCFYHDDKLAGVYYKQLITPLLKAIQDQKKELDTLKTKVAALEAK